MMKQAVQTFGIRALRLEEIRSLYRHRLTRDFPADERRPLFTIERALARDQYICYGAVSGEEVLAYAFFVKVGRWALVDYYAVEAGRRDSGIGSRFLQALVAGPLQGMECVLVEVEDPACARNASERETRERRKAFYLRNGLRETGVSAVVWRVQYCILEMPLGEPLPGGRVREIYGTLYRSMLPAVVYGAMVKV